MKARNLTPYRRSAGLHLRGRVVDLCPQGLVEVERFRKLPQKLAFLKRVGVDRDAGRRIDHRPPGAFTLAAISSTSAGEAISRSSQPWPPGRSRLR